MERGNISIGPAGNAPASRAASRDAARAGFENIPTHYGGAGLGRRWHDDGVKITTVEVQTFANHQSPLCQLCPYTMRSILSMTSRSSSSFLSRFSIAEQAYNAVV